MDGLGPSYDGRPNTHGLGGSAVPSGELGPPTATWAASRPLWTGGVASLGRASLVAFRATFGAKGLYGRLGRPGATDPPPETRALTKVYLHRKFGENRFSAGRKPLGSIHTHREPIPLMCTFIDFVATIGCTQEVSLAKDQTKEPLAYKTNT